MPPKKKVAAAAKVPKQESAKEVEQETEISLPEPKRIPKKPFFRSVDWDSLTKVQHIRVKLWKINSCSKAHFYGEAEDALSFAHLEKNTKKEYERKKKFTDAFKSLTLKKSLKHVKKIKFDPSLFTKHRFIKQLCSTWRLDSLAVSVSGELENYDVLKPFLNSTLKNCHLSWYVRENRIDSRLITIFRTVRKCKLILSSYFNSFYVWINTAKLLSPRKLKLYNPGSDFLSDNIINAPECFEGIKFANFDPYMRSQKVNLHLPSLPNLKELQFGLKNEEPGERIEDFSFMRQFSKIQSLKMILVRCEPANLDFLADLPDLKSLSFLSYLHNLDYLNREQRPMKSLPNLTQLEKFKLRLLMSNLFSMENIKDFIYQNKGLKELDLELEIQEIVTIFEEDEDSVLPNIEKLRLNFLLLVQPYVGAAKRIAEVLKTHDSIKELILEISHSYADLNAILLKDGVAKMKSLEKLTLHFIRTGGMEENKFKHLKDVFSNNPGLVELDLDLGSDVLGTRELGSILDGLMRLKNLKKLIFKARFAKMTPAAFNKLCGFIASLRHLKVLELDFKGISNEEAEELKQQILPRFPLSKDSFSFFSYAMDTSNSLQENFREYQEVFM